MGGGRSSLSCRYIEQGDREEGSSPVFKLHHSCRSDTPDAGQMAQTDSYVLIKHRLEPSPDREVASNYTHVPNKLGARSGKECVGLKRVCGNLHVGAGVLRNAKPSGNPSSRFEF